MTTPVYCSKLSEEWRKRHSDFDVKYDPLASKGVPPGTRVIVFDNLLYRDDVSTPLSVTMKPATVVRHYGKVEEKYSCDLSLGPYTSMVDVVFDHRPERESRGHFTYGIQLLTEDK